MTSATMDPARRGRPARPDLVDAAFLLVLGGFALAGLRTTYAGWSFLAVGLAGLVLGLVVSLVLLVRRQPAVTVAAAAVVAYFAFGTVITSRQQALAGFLPTGATLSAQARETVTIWKQVLTTLPPLAGSGVALLVPYLLGLVCGAVGMAVAHRITVPVAPVAAPALVLGVVIALGTHQPAEKLLDGVVFAAAALCWTALRSRRGRQVTRAARAELTRALAGAGVLGIAAVGALAAGPVLPGADTAHRVVLRDHVAPPFDLSVYPSPLVGYRKYTLDARQLTDQVLFTVSGLPAGEPVRIATLDNYDGSVWGAVNVPGDDFQRVGTTLPDSSGGRPVTVRITIAAAYAAAGDANVWLPDVGTVTGIDFTGADSAALAGSLRFNLTTSTGLVTARLRAGDTYTLRGLVDDATVPADAQPYGPPALADDYSSLVASRTASWTAGAVGIGPQLAAVAAYFKNSGGYTDGGTGFENYLPGHSVFRLSRFFNDPLPAGDDEQYAAAFALIANYLGMPARVVLGAIPKADGVVHGSDVHAWIEVHLASGVWAGIPSADFVPTTQAPKPQPPVRAQSANSQVVPPPNAGHPASSLVDSGTDSRGFGTGNTNPVPPRNRWLALLLVILAWAGPPVGLLVVAVATIVGWKARRRALRRTRGSPANRYAQGWRELVDQARDLGAVVPAGWTRQQEAAALAGHGIAALAGTADDAVYGPDDPTPDHATGYWREVDEARRRMAAQVAYWQRLRARVSIRSLRPRTTGSAWEAMAR